MDYFYYFFRNRPEKEAHKKKKQKKNTSMDSKIGISAMDASIVHSMERHSHSSPFDDPVAGCWF